MHVNIFKMQAVILYIFFIVWHQIHMHCVHVTLRRAHNKFFSFEKSGLTCKIVAFGICTSGFYNNNVWMTTSQMMMMITWWYNTKSETSFFVLVNVSANRTQHHHYYGVQPILLISELSTHHIIQDMHIFAEQYQFI